MIKNIVFDMGGVLIDYNMNKKAKMAALDEDEYNFFMNEIYANIEWIQSDRGVCSFKQAIKNCQKRLGNMTDDQVERIVNTAHYPMPPMKGMLNIVKKLKGNGYKLYVLSNAPDNHKLFEPLIEAFKYMDFLFFSCDYHMIKPEKEIYIKFADVNNVLLNECVFIDDSALNVEGAINAGMSGIQFKGDTKRLIKELNDIGVNV